MRHFSQRLRNVCTSRAANQPCDSPISEPFRNTLTGFPSNYSAHNNLVNNLAGDNLPALVRPVIRADFGPILGPICPMEGVVCFASGAFAEFIRKRGEVRHQRCSIVLIASKICSATCGTHALPAPLRAAFLQPLGRASPPGSPSSTTQSRVAAVSQLSLHAP
jgi:hypothetical protein